MVRPGGLHGGDRLDVEATAGEQAQAVAVQGENGGAAGLVEGEEKGERTIRSSSGVARDEECSKLIRDRQRRLLSAAAWQFLAQLDLVRPPRMKGLTWRVY